MGHPFAFLRINFLPGLKAHVSPRGCVQGLKAPAPSVEIRRSRLCDPAIPTQLTAGSLSFPAKLSHSLHTGQKLASELKNGAFHIGCKWPEAQSRG